MILTQAQRQERARVERYVKLIGPLPCTACGGTMLTELTEDEVGWQCILCPHNKLWNIPDGSGFLHLDPVVRYHRLSDDEMRRMHQRFADGARHIEIVREFHINRQAIAYLKARWLSDQAQEEDDERTG